MGGLDPSAPHGITIQLQSFDDIKCGIGCFVGMADHASGHFRADKAFQVSQIMLQAGNHLTAIASRRAPARLACFQHDDRHPPFRQMQRGGQPGKPTPDNCNIRLLVRIQGRAIGCVAACGCP